MKIGRRTQAYFVGFLIGVAIVSILIDSRRQRIPPKEPTYTWQRLHATVEDLPAEATGGRGIKSYVTAVEQVDSENNPTGKRGYFFADAEGKDYWWFGIDGQYRLYSAEKFKVTSRPGIPAETMKDGFEYQGHEVLSDPSIAPVYIVKVDAGSASVLVEAYENLLSKKTYIASIDWVPVGEE